MTVTSVAKCHVLRASLISPVPLRLALFSLFLLLTFR